MNPRKGFSYILWLKKWAKFYKSNFKDWVGFWTQELTLKTENVKILTTLTRVVSQGIKKSFEEVNWDTKSIEIHLPHYEIPQPSLRQHPELIDETHSGLDTFEFH